MRTLLTRGGSVNFFGRTWHDRRRAGSIRENVLSTGRFGRSGDATRGWFPLDWIQGDAYLPGLQKRMAGRKPHMESRSRFGLSNFPRTLSRRWTALSSRQLTASKVASLTIAVDPEPRVRPLRRSWTTVLETQQCEDCKADIGPDDAFVAIDIATGDPAAPLLTVPLHPFDCLTKFRLKYASPQ